MRVPAHSVLLSVLFAASCSAPAEDPLLPLGRRPPIVPAGAAPKLEPHLADLRQLTFGGENAEAYWSTDGRQLILQASIDGAGCDRIYRLEVPAEPGQRPRRTQVSSGKGATTCAYFLPGDQDILYASTHLGGDACPPKPDMREGYVWALYDSYDIFRAKADGSGITRLTETPGYDAEATVCKKDGSILFTSVRDGDLELYRMDADGKNVKRLTSTPGYDGGAFFSDDCSKIVWRASRPTGKDLEGYRALLAKGLVRPSKLELWVANADGTDASQVTYLDAASFGPYFFPGAKRIIFSSNYGDPKGREFDLFAINVDGTELERVTSSPGFDGFPMFSPDGKTLAFASNRATLPGKRDTNVFLAKWLDATPQPMASAADRIASDVRFLADPAREGRGVGTAGLERSGEHVEKRFQSLELEPAGSKGYRQAFDVTTGLTGKATLEIDGKAVEGARPLGFSASGPSVEAELVLAGYGIVSDKRDDYRGLDVKGKIVVVRRFVPEGAGFEQAADKRRHGDLRKKAFHARNKGAIGLVVVDHPERPAKGGATWTPPEEAKLPALTAEGFGGEGLPAVVAPRAALGPVVDRLVRRQKVRAKVGAELVPQVTQAFNVVARLRAAPEKKRPGTIVIGAHYDHLGRGGHGSLAPDKTEIHPGADDNASGTAALLEVARLLQHDRATLARDVLFVAFSAEERGIIGSSHFTKQPPTGTAMKDVVAMINMDMVGRVRTPKIDVIGHDTAKEWPDLLAPACASALLSCGLAQGGGYGPSDHSPFYGAGVPVLFFFSGTHSDYHKPSDTPDKVHFGGTAQVARAVAAVARGAAAKGELTYQSVAAPPPMGDVRSFGASLGTIPDYAPPPGTEGVLLSGVRPGGAAEKAGLARGDVIVKIGAADVRTVEDLMYVLGESKPGQKAKVVVMRDKKRVEVEVVFQGAKAH